MRVKLTKNVKVRACGEPYYVFALAGDVLKLDNKTAKTLLKNGAAVEVVEDDVEQPTEVDTPEPDTEEAEVDETKDILDELGFVEPEDRIEAPKKGKSKK